MRKKLTKVIDEMKAMYLKQAFEEAGGDNDGNGPDDGGGTDDGGKQGKTWTDAEVNALIDKKFAEWSKKSAAKSRAAEKAAELEKMTAEEKSAAKIKELEDKLTAMEKKEAIAAMTKSAHKILADEKITLPEEIISVLVTEEAESTKENISGFVKVFRAAVDAEVKARMAGKQPKAGSTKTTMTKEEILKIADPIERQKQIKKNISLFK